MSVEDAFEDVMDALSEALDGDDMYAERPAELVWKLRDQRDEALESVPQWIAVTPETMPKVDECVLANCATAVRVVQWRGNGWTTVPGGWSAKVSHWQPLPAPPVLPWSVPLTHRRRRPLNLSLGVLESPVLGLQAVWVATEAEGAEAGAEATAV